MALGIVQFINDYVGRDHNGDLQLDGIIKLIIDSLIVIAALVFVFIFLIKHTKTKKILVLSISFLR